MPRSRIAENALAEGDRADPSPSPARVDLRDAEAILRELRTVYREARAGRIELADATRLAFLLQTLGKLYEVHVLERRLRELEARLPSRSALPPPPQQ